MHIANALQIFLRGWPVCDFDPGEAGELRGLGLEGAKYVNDFFWLGFHKSFNKLYHGLSLCRGG